jgi:hypothetical protein
MGADEGASSPGLLIIQGYTPKQLQYGTGGPAVENLYTRTMLEGLGDSDVTTRRRARDP